ncbi:hypothetical protein CAOG_004844 [Capsaspora owczarzaki ATCC 30864]|uniref:EamA domain-containing protein n=1 Tax=Capsaspora owczarzaki (strain ATCC 30864) TaxID=595528 RepID=A0A0D2WQW9_CAPO3|nr:hypothetical protein CAOG_004844 [Capsaspora owczarzaki ATCC 30864]
MDANRSIQASQRLSADLTADAPETDPPIDLSDQHDASTAVIGQQASTAAAPSVKQQTPRERRRFAFGLFLLLLVVIIWVGSAELQQYIFDDNDFNHPMFLTYTNNAMFSVYLLGFLFVPAWRQRPFGIKRFLRMRASNDQPYEQLVNNPNEEANIAHDQGATTETAAVIPFTIRETMNVSLTFSILWFIANYLYNVALTRTSVASATILSSTSGLWTLLMGALFLPTSADKFTWNKLLAVALSIGGVVLVNAGEVGFSSGDIFALFSAVFYACYLVFFKRFGDEDRMIMAMFFGFVGLFNVVLTLPLFFIFDATGWEKFGWPPSRMTWLYLIVNAVIGTVVSDYVWLWATMLTSPAITTLGLSLTIPLAIVVDVLFKGITVGAMFACGTVLVFGGFVLLNCEIYYGVSVVDAVRRRLRRC